MKEKHAKIRSGTLKLLTWLLNKLLDIFRVFDNTLRQDPGMYRNIAPYNLSDWPLHDTRPR